MWLYIILSIIIIFILVMGFIKLRYRFWSKQPVFHYYNIWYWVRPPGIIQPAVPESNEYVNIINVKTRDVSLLNDTETKKVVNFIGNHYLRTKSTSYLPESKHVMTYFQNSQHKSYLAIYQRPTLLYENEKYVTEQKHIVDDEYLGMISARPLHVTFKNTVTFTTYYVDNLCVHHGHRKKGVAQKLIQTIYYDIRRKNSKINTCLFKREGEMTAIVPLITFSTKGYAIKDIPDTPLPHAAYSLLEITAKNIHMVIEFIYAQTKNYDCVIVPDVATIVTLIKSEIFDLRGIMYGGQLVALYVFRDAAVNYSISAKHSVQNTETKDSNFKDSNTIECIGSLVDTQHNAVLLQGFISSLHICCKKYNSKIKYLLIEETSQNTNITKHLQTYIHASLFLESPTAFFFYNYGCLPLKSAQTFLIY
jgi:GNAT superfamily N-acetyltransferase